MSEGYYQPSATEGENQVRSGTIDDNIDNTVEYRAPMQSSVPGGQEPATRPAYQDQAGRMPNEGTEQNVGGTGQGPAPTHQPQVQNTSKPQAGPQQPGQGQPQGAAGQGQGIQPAGVPQPPPAPYQPGGAPASQEAPPMQQGQGGPMQYQRPAQVPTGETATPQTGLATPPSGRAGPLPPPPGQQGAAPPPPGGPVAPRAGREGTPVKKKKGSTTLVVVIIAVAVVGLLLMAGAGVTVFLLLSGGSGGDDGDDNGGGGGTGQQQEAEETVQSMIELLDEKNFEDAGAMMMDENGNFLKDTEPQDYEDGIDQLEEMWNEFNVRMTFVESRKMDINAQNTSVVYACTIIMNMTYMGESEEEETTIYVALNEQTGKWGVAFETFAFTLEPDQYEPDDTWEQAGLISIGDTQTHSIDEEGDEDWFSFTIDEDRYVTIDTTGETDGDTEMYLYDEEGASSDNYMSDNDDGYENGLYSKIERFLSAGTYYVRMTGYGTEETVIDYTISISVSEGPEGDDYEPDGSPGQATEIDFDESQSHTIHVEGDEDWFTFTQDAETEVAVDVTGDPNLEIFLYDEYDTSNSMDRGSVWLGIETDLSPGKYYVKVDASSVSDPISYQIVISQGSGFVPLEEDDFEPDDSSGTATDLVVGTPQTHSIHDPYDEDWFTFTLDDPTNVIISTSGESGGDTQLELYDGSVDLIDSDDDGGDGLFSQLETNLGPGTYYVKVNGYSGETIAQYQVLMTVDTIETDSYEPDDTETQSTILMNGISQTHSIHIPDDVDWFTFTLESTADVTIETMSTPGLYLSDDTVMYLYDDMVMLIEENDDKSLWDGYSSITIELEAGQYLVKIEEYSQDETISSYDIILTY